MGAVVNMRPDLFNAVIMRVPFVDCLTDMLDDTLPLTFIEKEEWGDPNVCLRLGFLSDCCDSNLARCLLGCHVPVTSELAPCHASADQYTLSGCA